MVVRTLADRFGELVVLRQTERALQALPGPAHASMAADVARAFTRRDAARTLWGRRAMRSDAVDLLRSAGALASSAVARFAGECAPPPAWLARAEPLAARAGASAARLPEGQGAAELDESAFWEAHDDLLSLEQALGPFATPAASIGRLRWRRARVLAAVALLVLVGVTWFRSRDVMRVTDSAHRPDSPPASMMDHDVRTSWSLPDGRLGWIELQFTKPRVLKTLHVVPYDPPRHDRATKDVHVTAYLNGKRVKEMDHTFPNPPNSSDVNWTDVPLDVSYVDRVRIEVKSYAGASAAFAEIEPRGP